MRREAILGAAVTATGSRSLLRRMNSFGILSRLAKAPRTQRELAADSGLSRTAVDAVVGDLIDLGWIEARDSRASGQPGRPAATYEMRADLGLLLSLDIGANHIEGVVSDFSRTILAQDATSVDEGAPAATRIAIAVELARALIERAGRRLDDVWTACIGSPGVIDTDGRVRHFGGEGMPGWVGSDLKSVFSDALGCAVLVEGDVALGAHAELAEGRAEGFADVVYVLCGVRTSAALILDGRVRRGAHGAAGIVGELAELKWQELNERYGAALLPAERPTREEIFARARAGDPVALQVVDEFADDLASGAAAMVLAVDPALVVVGGGSAPGADVFLADFRRHLARRCPEMPEVVASDLGSEAVARGGLRVAALHVLSILEASVTQGHAFPGPRETLAALHDDSPLAK